MALQDYSDEDDYYSQGFEKKDVISVWLGLTECEGLRDADTLQDLCGVGYYSLDQQEGYSFDFALVDLPRLLERMSYSSSYAGEVIAAAKSKGIQSARFITIQFDFAYDPAGVTRKIRDDPVFIGVFPYSKK